jgi:uncharacterized protein
MTGAARQRIETRRSGIAGLGVFALQDFRAGEIVAHVPIEREVTEASPLQRGEAADHCRYVVGRTFLIGAPARHVNHSCAPNAYHLDRPYGWFVAAMRDIRAGEEITYDYMINTHGGASWRCACGAPGCRGKTVASFFDLAPALQRAYARYLAPWFVAAHFERIAPLTLRPS